MTTIIVDRNNREIVVQRTERVVQVDVEGVQGPVGPVGPSGGQPFVHSQITASDTWVVNHDLGRRPAVEIYTVGWVEVDAEVIHTSTNQVQVIFNTPRTGFVLCA